MFAALYYRLKYPHFLRHQLGIERFADLCLTSCLREYTNIKQSAAARIEALKEASKGLASRRRSLDPDSIPSYETTLRNARQLRFEQVLWLLLVGAEGALTYFATLVFLPGRGLLLAAARTLIALVATAAAVAVAERFIDEFLAPQVVGDGAPSVQKRRRTWTWGVLLCGLEVTLWGLASIRAGDMEGSTHSPILYVGLILLSVLLAPAAGGIRHDLMNRLGPVHRALSLHAVDAALERLATRLAEERHDLEARWDNLRHGFYNRLADFRTYKEIFNFKRDIKETTKDKYFDNRAAFCDEAQTQRDTMYGEEALFTDDLTIKPAEESMPPTDTVRKPVVADEQGVPRRLLLTR